VLLLLAGMLEKLLRDPFGVNAVGGKMVPLVAQHAHELGGERLVQHVDDTGKVGLVAARDRSLVDVLAGAPADLGDVGKVFMRCLGDP